MFAPLTTISENAETGELMLEQVYATAQAAGGKAQKDFN